MRKLWVEFQGFKTSKRFRVYGLSGPYQDWTASIKALRDHPTYSKQLLVICGVVPAELIGLAIDYAGRGPDEHGRSVERSFTKCFSGTVQ
jgi:hypothetical protein